MEEPPKKRGAARDQLVATAAELFYRSGVAASGVDAITRESGVSKPTLYSHFGSKAQLVAAALEWQHERRRGELHGYLDGLDVVGIGRILAVFDWAADVASDVPGFRGCAFVNAAAELAAPEDEPGRVVARQHKLWLRGLLAELAAEAGLDDPDGIGEELLLLLDGAYARLAVDRTGQPFRVARRLAEALLRQRVDDARDIGGGQP